MRLQRALARAGVASRRRSEELIRAGKVRVNGEVATIGAVVDPARDVITIGSEAVRQVHEATIVLHKPTACVVSKRDPEGRPTIFDLVPEIPGLTYVGRLDVMTSGLLLLTTDGELANVLTHPRFAVPREYKAVVRGLPANAIRAALKNPVVIDGRKVAITRSRVRSLDRGRSQIMLTLVEGRNRIVRRVCEKMGVTLESLVRVSHGPVQLGHLSVGSWRHLTTGERRRLEQLGTGQ